MLNVPTGLVVALTVGHLACSPIPAPDPEASEEWSSGDSQAVATAETEVPRLAPGDPLPGFRLATDEGAELSREELVGSVTVITFFTSRCPGDMCPRLLTRLAGVRDRLRPEIRSRTRFLAVTLDPDHDRADVLAELGERLGTTPGAWEIAAPVAGSGPGLAEAAGVVVWPRGDGSLEHNLLTLVFDESGRLADRLSGLDVWSGQDLLASVAHVARR